MSPDSSDYAGDAAWSGCIGGRGYSSFTKYRACDDYAAALSTEISLGLIFNSFPGNREPGVLYLSAGRGYSPLHASAL
jgi:hypothetical protein